MTISPQKLLKAVPIAMACALVTGSLKAAACKRTAESAEMAFRSAVIQELKNQKDLDGFQIVGKIRHHLNIYEVHLKKGSAQRTATFEAVGQPDCQVQVKRLPDQ